MAEKASLFIPSATEQSLPQQTKEVSQENETRSSTQQDNLVASLQDFWYPKYTTKRRSEGLGANRKRFVFVVAIISFGCCCCAIGAVYRKIIMETIVTHQTSSVLLGGLLLFLLPYLIYKRRRTIFLVDFSIYQPPEELSSSKKQFIENTFACGNFPEDSCLFQKRLIEKSGLGDNTYFPKGIAANPPDFSMASAREECEMVFTGCIDDLFARTGLKPNDIDILIATCSLFNPTPSITSMIINKYKMKSSIQNFNLSGMGCSAGVVAVDFARQLMEQQFPNSNCLIFCHENITQNWYLGTLKGMLIPNVLFRMGGACVLLSNKPKYAFSAKYKLHNSVRVHNGARDESYQAVFQREDDEGHIGVKLSRELFKEVTIALTKNLTILSTSVLPLSEMIKFAFDFIKRKLSNKYATTHPQYVPDFRKAFDHYCIHSGGRAIIDGIQDSFKLSDEDCKPSRATLYRYGNTSSSSVWYELNYIELCGKLQQGDRIWQLTFGSGVKVNSAVWVAM